MPRKPGKPTKATKPVKPTKPAPKKGARSKPDWAPALLAALAASGNITAACAEAGVNRDTFYERRKRDPEFRRAVRASFGVATDALEAEARRRALEGCERPVFHAGEEVGRIREYSDTLMIFLLKAHRPRKFRERFEHQHKGQVRHEHALEALTDDQLAAIAAGHGQPAEPTAGGGGAALPPAGPA